MDGIKIKVIKGTIVDYKILTAETGFCFYDGDEPENERNYLTEITTPITDAKELERKYIVVQGNAEELNAELKEEILRRVEYGEV